MIEHLPKVLQGEIFSHVNIHGLFSLGASSKNHLNIVNDYLQAETPEQLLAVVNKLSGLDALHVINQFEAKHFNDLNQKFLTTPLEMTAAEILSFALMRNVNVNPDPQYLWLRNAVNAYRQQLSPGMVENFTIMALISESIYHNLRKEDDPFYDGSIKNEYTQHLKQRKNIQYLNIRCLTVRLSMTKDETLNLVGVDLRWTLIHTGLFDAKINFLSPNAFTHPRVFHQELNHLAKILDHCYWYHRGSLCNEIMRKCIQFHAPDCLGVAIDHPLFRGYPDRCLELTKCKNEKFATLANLPKELQGEIFSYVNIHGLFNLAGSSKEHLRLVYDYLRAETPEQLLAIVNKLSGLDALHVIEQFKAGHYAYLEQKFLAVPQAMNAAEMLCFFLMTNMGKNFNIIPESACIGLRNAIDAYKHLLSMGMLENFNIIALRMENYYRYILCKYADPARGALAKNKFIQSLKERKNIQYLNLQDLDVYVPMNAGETLNLVGVNLSKGRIDTNFEVPKFNFISPQAFSSPESLRQELNHVAKALIHLPGMLSILCNEIIRKSEEFYNVAFLDVAMNHPVVKGCGDMCDELAACKNNIELRALKLGQRR
jgi:hypothetical protein